MMVVNQYELPNGRRIKGQISFTYDFGDGELNFPKSYLDGLTPEARRKQKIRLIKEERYDAPVTYMKERYVKQLKQLADSKLQDTDHIVLEALETSCDLITAQKSISDVIKKRKEIRSALKVALTELEFIGAHSKQIDSSFRLSFSLIQEI